MRDLTVIIPAKNEEKTVAQVIDNVLAHPRVAQVIAVNDGSTDNTLTVLQKYTDKITVIDNGVNRGKGYSMRAGIAAATAKYTLIQDADLELSPSSYDILFAAMDSTGADLVNATRDLNNVNTKWISKLASMFIPVAVFILFGKRITDVVSCYKLMTTENYRKLNLQSDRFEIETEIIVKAIKAGFSIAEVTVPFAPRGMAEGKHVRWVDGLKVVKLLLKYRFGLN